MAKKRRSKKSTRTITPEQQAKMQEGRRKAAVRKERINQLQEYGLDIHENVSQTERMLNSLRRR